MKIYLSPSNQPANQYAFGNTNEKAECIKFAEAVKTALIWCGFEVKIGLKGSLNIAEANAWGADLYIVIHTNAGGGKGVSIFVYDTADKNMKYAKPIYDELRAITLSKAERGIKKAAFTELTKTKAISIYVEVDFHDNADIAKWLISNTALIGQTICKGICIGTGVPYIAVDKPKPANPINNPTTSETVYPVKSGDTLGGIASKYGTTYQKLGEYNGIKSPYVIYSGQKIKIPTLSIQVTTPKPTPKPIAPKPICTGKAPAFRWVRKTASKFGKKVGDFKTGQTFTILSKSGIWYKISYNGATAYTYAPGVTVSGIIPK